ncbi:MAG: hypothetical protein ABR606_13320 [Vicinamibacterales bacterium]
MLRSVTSTLAACALAGLATISAQEPAQPPPEAEPATQAATLTGCVQQAKTTDGGTAYVLNNVEGGTAAMYLLVGPPPSELQTHVNHKVEVTGQVQVAAPPPADEGTSSGQKVLRPPFVQVEAVKTVADSCK